MYKNDKKKCLFAVLACFLIVAQNIVANPISYNKARNIAKKYVDLEKSNKLQSLSINQEKPYYIFNDKQNKGFVIVAGDDQLGQVLAYSNTNSLDTTNAKEGLAWMLKSYNEAYNAIKNNNKTLTIETHNTTQKFEPVAPLIKTQWGQSYPYSSKLIVSTFTGCVATALCQIMNYHKWPKQGTGEHEYTIPYYGVQNKIDFSKSKYDWDNMLNQYSTSSTITQAQKDAVGILMRDVGCAVDMMYSPSGSGAYPQIAAKALRKYFDYDVANIEKVNEGAEGFINFIRSEIRDGFPVYLGGYPSGQGEGHAWVGDGYDEDGLIHMNFGWDGQSNGYFSILNMFVESTGSEFNGRPLYFNKKMNAMAIHPKKPGVKPINRAYAEDSPQLFFNAEGYLTLKADNKEQLDATKQQTLEFNYFVNKGMPFKGDIGLLITKENGDSINVVYSNDHNEGGFTQRIYGKQNNAVMGKDNLMNVPQIFSVNFSTLNDGYYVLHPICVARNDDGSWQQYSQMKIAPTLELEKKGNTLRVSQECGTTDALQLLSQPIVAKEIEQGKKAHFSIQMKWLKGFPKDLIIRTMLKNNNGKTLAESFSSAGLSFGNFGLLEVPIALNIPSDVPIGDYKLEFEALNSFGFSGSLKGDETLFAVQPIHNKENAYIAIAQAKASPMFDAVNFALVDSYNERVEANQIDLSKGEPFKIYAGLKIAEDKTYKGNFYIVGENTQTKERVTISSSSYADELKHNFNYPVYSNWLKLNNLPIQQNQTYKLIAMGKKDGEFFDFEDAQNKAYFISIKNNIAYLTTQNIATNINNNSIINNNISLTINGNNIVANGNNITSVSAYNTNGMLVGENAKTINLAKGYYIIKVNYNKNHTKVFKVCIL